MSTGSGVMPTKIQCHDSELTTMPETVGPIAGPTAMTIEFSPITVPLCRSGTRVRVVLMSSGITMAVPTAWRTRAASRTPKTGATMASSVPARKLPSANTNRARIGKRCSRKPVIGMTTAMVSRNPVVSHCPAAAETP